MLRYILILTVILGNTLPKHEAQEQFLDLVISAEKTTYFLYEPIVLNIVVINNGSEPIQGDFNHFGGSLKLLKFFYRKIGREYKRYSSLWLWLGRGLCEVGGEKQFLDPGDQRNTKVMLFFDTSMEQNYEHKFVLDEPGEYEFKVSFQYAFSDQPKVLESNILHLTVINPPEGEQEALTWWKDKDLALVVQGDNLNGKGVRKLRVFLERFPESQYAATVREASERVLEKLTTKAKARTLTRDEKALHNFIRPNK